SSTDEWPRAMACPHRMVVLTPHDAPPGPWPRRQPRSLRSSRESPAERIAATHDPVRATPALAPAAAERLHAIRLSIAVHAFRNSSRVCKCTGPGSAVLVCFWLDATD